MNTAKRHFCYTLNNYTKTHETLYQAIDCVYHVYGREVGASGTKHLQGTICFKNARTLRGVLRILQVGGAMPHVEPCVDVHKSIAYCKKDGNFWQQGKAPLTPKDGGAIEKKRWENILAKAQAGKGHRLPAREQVQLCRTIDYIHAKTQVAQSFPDTNEQMIWIWGASGTGKSRWARQTYPNAYLKMANKWWDGYKGEQVVLLEDLDTAHSCLGHHLKIWGDRYQHLAEKKGLSCKIRPGLFIVTSNWHPSSIWPLQADLEAIERRFRVIQFPLEKDEDREFLAQHPKPALRDEDTSDTDSLPSAAEPAPKRRVVLQVPDEDEEEESESSSNDEDEEPSDGISLGSQDTA